MTACRWCIGLRKVVCERCDGARVSKSDSGALGPCGACNAKGFLRCSHCVRGGVACEICTGTGIREQPCRACQGSGEMACSGCAEGAYRSWEISGDLLAALGDEARARAQYGIAIARCRQLFAKRRQEGGSDQADLDQQQAKELQRLEARAAAVRE
jgi:hypothetical protein